MNTPSTPQVRFLMNLARDRRCDQWGTTPAERVAHVQRLLDDGTLDKKLASQWIDALKRQPLDTATPQATETLTPGVYRTNGTVYVVKPNRDKTRLYAKVLVEIGGERATEFGTVVNIDFQYAPGAIRSIRPAHRLPLAEAERLAVRYGRCIACGRDLKDATSVRRGIGPVCVKNFAGSDTEPEADNSTNRHYAEVWAGANGRV